MAFKEMLNSLNYYCYNSIIYQFCVLIYFNVFFDFILDVTQFISEFDVVTFISSVFYTKENGNDYIN